MEQVKEILILSFYFYPDLCAGSFRTTALVKALKQEYPELPPIHVFTTRPNRYHSFSVQAPSREEWDGILIRRFDLPEHKSGFLDQSRAFLSFARQVMAEVEQEDYQLVFATSSRLMTAALGAYVARKKRAKLYLDIRDIFADTMKDILPGKLSLIMHPILSMIEKKSIKRAEKINLVSPGFGEYFRSRYPNKRFSYFTNGIDEEFIMSANCSDNVDNSQRSDKRLTVLYAGNIGEGQGLHVIIPSIARKMPQILFKIIGDGGKKLELKKSIVENGLKNVKLVPPVDREELIKAYQQAHVLFLHLNNYPAFQKVLPSKIFEYAAMGKPIWAGVAGYAAKFIKEEVENAALFPPCNSQEAVAIFKKLQLHYTPRPSFIERYHRNKIMIEMAKDILAISS